MCLATGNVPRKKSILTTGNLSPRYELMVKTAESKISSEIGNKISCFDVNSSVFLLVELVVPISNYQRASLPPCRTPRGLRPHTYSCLQTLS